MYPLGTTSNGAVAEFLAGLGVPYAPAIGSAVSFIFALLGVYVVGRVVVLPHLEGVLAARGLDRHAKVPLRKLTHGVVVFGAVTVAFGFAGYGNFVTSLATIAAAATLAIGFAMRETLENLVAAVFIFTDRPFRIDDWIEWEGHSGIVEDISFRVTRVRTFDNELLTVPNSQLTHNVIKNPVDKDKLRIKVLFGIDYDDDIDRATEIITSEAKAHEDILADPAPSVRVTELADSYVGLQTRIWIGKPIETDFVRVRSEYVTAVKTRFDQADITIPFPQRSLSGAVEPAEHAVGRNG